MKCFAVLSKDEDVRIRSRSGGIFTALSDLFLNYNGVIYGCVLNEKQEAVHIRATNKDERNEMCGSKYVQSRMGRCFSLAKQDLEKGRMVLFSGTSCQIAGLKKYLGKDYQKLLCVDIVCQGVPSPYLWREYLALQDSKILKVDFRNKNKYGWRESIETLYTDTDVIDSKIWANIFHSGNALRPICYNCPFKSVNHPGDITIGDYWGIENVAPEFDDNKGVSIVLVNSDRGKVYFEQVKNVIHYKETKIEDSMQRAFIRPEYKPKTRKKFWNDVKRKGFRYIARKYGGNTTGFGKLTIRYKNMLKRILKRIKSFYF